MLGRFHKGKQVIWSVFEHERFAGFSRGHGEEYNIPATIDVLLGDSDPPYAFIKFKLDHNIKTLNPPDYLVKPYEKMKKQVKLQKKFTYVN